MTDREAPDAPPPAQDQARDGPARAQVILAAALVLVAAIVVAFTLGRQSTLSTARPPVAPPAEPPAARRPAPLLSLRSLRGAERINLADFRGRVVVLNFFASWCGPCALEAADLERTWQANKGRNVTFLGVAIQDTYEDAAAFLKRHGITYPAVFDANNEIMTAYRVTGIPTTVIVDPEGRIASVYAGIFVGDEGVARLQARIDAAGRDAR